MMQQGQRFARLIALSVAERAKNGNEQWSFQCDCGNTTIARTVDVRRGFKRSCGCLMKETSALTAKMNATHGMVGTSEYNTWAHIIQRCTNPLNSGWKCYGARGISVCERWLKFENFLADMGQRPAPHLSIDRINNDGNYEPSNCRWATRKQQMNNRQPYRNTRKRNHLGHFLPSDVGSPSKAAD
jgi:hypothetical protein